MTSQDAEAIVLYLSERFGLLSDEEAGLYVADLMMLPDRKVAADAARRLGETARAFPPIGEFRAAYRSVAEAARNAPRTPRADSDIPEWVHVWFWQMKRTRLERQEARESNLPVERRAPIKLRDFPQMENPYPTDGNDPTYAGPDAYSLAEYEQIRAEWVEAGSPRAESAEEIVAGAAR